MYCWGHNQYGQLGDPSFFHRRLVADAPEVMQSVSVVSVGQLHKMTSEMFLQTFTDCCNSIDQVMVIFAQFNILLMQRVRGANCIAQVDFVVTNRRK